MFSLLSTDCVAVDQHADFGQYKHMVDKNKNAGGTVSEKLDYIKVECGIDTDTELADILGLKSSQVINNWRKRNSWTREAMDRIPDRTGASLDWLRGYGATAFPNGPKVKKAASLEKRVQRSEADIDQARKALFAMFSVLDSRLPELKLAEAYSAALEAVAPSAAYAERGFHALLSAGVDNLAEQAAEDEAVAQPREVHQRVSKKAAK